MNNMSAKAKVQARIGSYLIDHRLAGKPGQAAGTLDKGPRLDILLAAPKLGADGARREPLRTRLGLSCRVMDHRPGGLGRLLVHRHSVAAGEMARSP
jgi:hypothetical protein